MRLLYSLFVCIYTILIRLASLYNTKAGLWVKGRQGIFKKLREQLKDEAAPLLWFHASSLGEFEQGRPLIERIKESYPGYKILLTFFSPSGYEIRKNYQNADYIFYLPSDTLSHAKKFVSIVNPKIAVFIKYEYWFNYLHILSERQIRVFFISAIFRKEHYFFKFYGSWSLKQLRKVNYFFVQDEFSKNILNTHGFSKVKVTGDTRFDRVLDITSEPKRLSLIEEFKGKNHLFIAGSTWAKDIELIIQLSKVLPDTVKFIIAPHVIDKDNILELNDLFGSTSCLYSNITTDNASLYRTVIIDNIGMLSTLYSYGHIAYIGGGFGKGIHNILEAVCFGLPVIFGPRYKKFREAHELIALDAAFSITNFEELKQICLNLLEDKKIYDEVSEKGKKYVTERAGVTERILEEIETYLK